MPSPPIRDLVRWASTGCDNLSVYDRLRVAYARRLDASAVSALARDEEEDVREAIACRRDLPPALEAELARDLRPRVRRCVAQRRRLSPKVLVALAKDPDAEVRYHIANRSDVPLGGLRRLARDPDINVRRAVAWAPHCPVEVLDHLARDWACDVREVVAKAKRVSIESLDLLARDGIPMVLAKLCQRADSLPARVTLTLAGNPHLFSCRPEEIAMVAARLDVLIPYGLKHITRDSIRLLLQHQDRGIRGAGRRLACRWNAHRIPGAA